MSELRRRRRTVLPKSNDVFVKNPGEQPMQYGKKLESRPTHVHVTFKKTPDDPTDYSMARSSARSEALRQSERSTAPQFVRKDGRQIGRGPPARGLAYSHRSSELADLASGRGSHHSFS